MRVRGVLLAGGQRVFNDADVLVFLDDLVVLRRDFDNVLSKSGDSERQAE